jgi:hypothetical protein
MKTEEQEWEENVENCALSIMNLCAEYTPRELLPALVACIQTTVTLSAKDGKHASEILGIVRRKIDVYEEEADNWIKIIKAVPEGTEQ